MKTSLMVLLCVTLMATLGNAKTIQDTQKVLKYDATARQFSANEGIAHKQGSLREKRDYEDEISDTSTMDLDDDARQNGKFLKNAKKQRKSRGLANLTKAQKKGKGKRE